MTTFWKIPANYFEGQTVVIFGTAPNLTAEVVADCMKHKTIAIHRAIRLAPKADMVFSLDGRWPQEIRDFKGLKITGCADDTLDAKYIGLCYETIQLTKNHTIEVRLSGLSAIRFAANGGAKRIILAGYDPETAAHFHDGAGTGKPYPHLSAGLESIIKELGEKGVVIKFYKKSEVVKAKQRQYRGKKNG